MRSALSKIGTYVDKAKSYTKLIQHIISRPTHSAQMISKKLKIPVKFLTCNLPVDMGKDGPSSPPTPTPPPPCYSFGNSQAPPDGVLLLDIALEKLQQTKAVMSGFCCASSPFPPCSSQGRKVLRRKPRDARPPATTCFLLQPSAINSPPSKIYPAFSHNYSGKCAPSLSELRERFHLPKRSLGLSQRTWKAFPEPATLISAARRFPSLFQTSHWENDFLFSFSISPNIEQVKRNQSDYPGGQKAEARAFQ